MPEDFNHNKNGGDLSSWIPTIIMLICFLPVGVIMLLVKLFGLSGGASGGRRTSQHPYDVNWGDAEATARDWAQQARAEAQSAAQQARAQAQSSAQQARAQAQSAAQQARARAQAAAKPPKKKNKQEQFMRKRAEEGKGLMVAGGILAAIFGMGALAGLFEALRWGGLSYFFSYGLEEFFFPLAFCGGGLVMLYYGLTKRRKFKRYRKYLALIGKRDSISVSSLAQAMGVSVSRACDDLQDMLDDGLFPMGFLDVGSGRLILSDEGLREDPAPQPEAPREEVPRGMEREDAVLMEIRQVNDAITDATMSRKIDRIGEITGKIFAYLREKPDKEGQLRSFLSYYLPTTLKILRAYAQMEAQGIEGDNITAAKERIEGMMDKVVDGFEKQLDKLFQDDAMDITTDVAVLERMLDKDGLGGGQGLTLGG